MSETRRRNPWPRIVFAVLLGGLTTLGVSWGLALWAPIQNGNGVVALDGDHLQPWLMRVWRPGAERLIFFEKGRIYSRPGVGPANGSSCAVACWSFATSTRTSPKFSRGEVVVPPKLEEEMAHRPQTCWGVAEDRRGWPMAAFSCSFIGTTATDSPYVYLVHDGVRRDPPAGIRESLADVRALPTRPIWRGLIVNSAIAAVAWWLVLAAVSWGVGSVRAAFRKPAGCCPKCGYDLKSNWAAGCPECGWGKENTGDAEG